MKIHRYHPGIREKILVVLVIIGLLVGVVIYGPQSASSQGMRSNYPTPVVSISHKAKPTPTTTPQKTIHLASANIYTLKATEIDGTNAKLSLLPDPLHPTLTFSSVTMQGMQLSHPLLKGVTLTMSATGTVTGTGVAIKTSIFRELVTALGSFTNKADLLILIVGGTVKHLTLKNATLQIDTSITATTMSISGLQVSLH